jgi:hypothetical protein
MRATPAPRGSDEGSGVVPAIWINCADQLRVTAKAPFVERMALRFNTDTRGLREHPTSAVIQARHLAERVRIMQGAQRESRSLPPRQPMRSRAPARRPLR